jgi:1-acyl-sn-glycerol-3-phosphate acyltransferase
LSFPRARGAQDGDVGPFKSGLFHLARTRPDAELVPVYLENLNRILPKGEFLPVPMLSRVVFGRPLATIPGEDKPAFLARAREGLIHLRSLS